MSGINTNIANFAGLKALGVNPASPVPANFQQQEAFTKKITKRQVPESFSVTLSNTTDAERTVNLFDAFKMNAFAANAAGVNTTTSFQGGLESLLKVIENNPYAIGGFEMKVSNVNIFPLNHQIFDADSDYSNGKSISQEIAAAYDANAQDLTTRFVALWFQMDGYMGFKFVLPAGGSLTLRFNVIGQYRIR